MGMFDFVRTAGEKLRGGPDLTDKEVSEHLLGLGLQLKPLTVICNADAGEVRLIGWAATLADKEKAIVAAGNIDGVAKVEDRLKVGVPDWLKAPAEEAASAAAPADAPDPEAVEPELEPADEPQARFHTVKSGDTLSAISKAVYGDASKYQKIFEANRPMLKDPNRIYPGQVLRIPE